MTTSKPLTELQLKAIALLSQGLSEGQVAESLGKSRSWVQALKRHPNYQEIRSENISGAVQNLREQTKNFFTDDLVTFKERYAHASNLLFQASEIYLAKLQQRVQSLEIEDISASKLGGAIVAGANALNLAMQIEESVLGLEEILWEVEGLEKINSEGRE